MKPNESEDSVEGKKADPQRKEGPEVYAINRGRSGWTLSRRSLFSAAAAAVPRRAQAAVCAAGAVASADPIRVLAISPDGRLLASGGDEPSLVKLWSLPDGALLKPLNDTDSIFRAGAIAFSPDGLLAAVGAVGDPSDFAIRLWSLPNRTLLRTLAGHTAGVDSVAISPDGHLLVSGSSDDTVRLWSLPDGALLKTITSTLNDVSGVAISPDGRLLAVGGEYDFLELRSLPDGALLKTLTPPVPDNSVLTVAISPDGRLLVSGHYGNVINLWSLPDGVLLKTLNSSAVESAAISPDGRLLASGGGDTISLWSLPDGALLKTLTANGVNSVAISPDGRLLASDGAADGYGTITLWSLPDGKPLPVCLMDPADRSCGVLAITYTIAGGTYTVPASSPIPTGATCTCNTVSGFCGGGCPNVYFYPN